MNKKILPLNKLDVGKNAIVVSLLFEGNERRRMLDLGVIRGTLIEAVQKSPAGDPIAYFIRGTLIAIRSEDAEKCLVEV
ncbi:feoA domain protein [Clostridium sp. CAG:557]|nr:feoA domain protein [Clostridium sp. CAG:557]